MRRILATALVDDVAKSLDVKPELVKEAIYNAQKEAIKRGELGCSACMGSGVVECRGSCRTSFQSTTGKHNHVCLDCGGRSTYWASVGFKP